MPLRFLLVAGLLAMILLLLNTPSLTGNALAAESPCAWQDVAEPTPGADRNALWAIDGSSPDDIWAVGDSSLVLGTDTAPLAVHWNGVAWSAAPTPDPATYSGFADVAAISPNDVWAVGASSNDLSVWQPLAMHWDGSAWAITPFPNVSPQGLALGAVSAVSSDDVWAIGSVPPSPGPESFIFHWDGASWTLVATPSSGPENSLGDIVLLSANDGWAVGQHPSVSTAEGWILRWNGSAWTDVSPPPELDHEILVSVAAVDSQNAWIVGGGNNLTSSTLSIAKHWDGVTWVNTATPSNGSSDFLRGVDAASPTSVWAVGDYQTSFGAEVYPLMLHWDGNAWEQQHPLDYLPGRVLFGVYAVDNDEAWAAGVRFDENNTQLPVLLHCTPFAVGGTVDLISRSAGQPGSSLPLVGLVTIATLLPTSIWLLRFRATS